MRIALANPPITDFYFTRGRMSGLGALTVKSLLEAAGHTVAYFDFPGSAGRARTVQLPDELFYLSPFLLAETGPTSFFTGYKRLGGTPAACANTMLATRPDAVLISCFAYAYSLDAIALAEEIRNADPSVPIIVGGAGATVHPEGMMRSPAIDIVVAGEAETNLLSFFEGFCRGDADYHTAPNVFLRDNGAVARTGNPRYTSEDDLSWIYHVGRSSAGSLSVTTSLSRGCPKRCGFCSSHLCHGKTMRRVSLDLCLRGIDELPDTPSIHLNFEDDNLLHEYGYFYEICRRINKRYNQTTLSAQNGIDVSQIDAGLLPELKHLGFQHLDFSLVSTDEKILSSTQRKHLSSSIADICRKAHVIGIETTTYFICGLDYDSDKSTVQNLLFLHELPTKIGISLFYAVPGIAGYADPSLFSNSSPRLCCGSSAYPWTGSLTTSQLITAFRIARFSNLVKSSPQTRETHADLINTTVKKKRLHTWKKTAGRAEVIEIPNMDNSMVEEFIRGAQASTH